MGWIALQGLKSLATTARPAGRRLAICTVIGAIILLTAASRSAAQDAKQRMFERVFGDAVKLDPAMAAKVKAVKPGEYVLVDKDGDGKHEEAWFIDPSPGHTAAVRPVLVRVIDRDGDLDADGRPDLDSDLYVGDWKADGTVDSVVEYVDTDHDNDVDEMGICYWLPKDHFLGKGALRYWWARDDGDDNQLWYDVSCTYDQVYCQWRCHFSGDETFVAFGLTEGSDHWQSVFENPFLFYDPDHDGASEEVLRFSGLGDEVEALRWSFDADDDAYGRHTHDYDFSITAIAANSRYTRSDAKAGSDLKIPGQMMKGMTLRGIPTDPWLQREHARKFAAEAPWARAMLSWDEINANTDANVAGDPHERWEGVIVQGGKDFPQVGGPPCGTLNKRFELVENPKPPLRLYYAPTDGRLHLFGAQRGWMDVDYNLDGKVDARYEWIDTNADGYFDRRQLDIGADGRVDFTYMIGAAGLREVPLDFTSISTLWKRELPRTLEDSQALIDAELSALALAAGLAGPAAQPCPALEFFRDKLAGWIPQAHLGERVRSTPAGASFYANYVRDSLLPEYWHDYGEHGSAYDVYQRCSAADYRGAAEIILKEPAKSGVRVNEKAFGSFSKRIAVRVGNPGQPQRDGWPVVLKIQSLKAAAPDFNADACAVVAPHRWLAWRQVPHQVDDIGAGDGPELSFLADLPADGNEDWYVYYSPSGRVPTTFPARTATAQDWVPPNIGWESDRAAYRAYWGQFDFFGKKADALIYPKIGKVSYHNETEWGVDALSTGKTGGIGGITLYRGEKAYPVWCAKGEGSIEFQKRALCTGPIRTAIEITARHVLPDESGAAPAVVMHCLIYAGRQETEVRVVAPADCDVAPGLVKLTHETTFEDHDKGCFGAWGYQLPEIGEIGMALVFDPKAFKQVADEPELRRVRLAASLGETGGRSGRVRYWITGDWRRGRQAPVAPTISNWRLETQQLAKLLLKEVDVRVAASESVK